VRTKNKPIKKKRPLRFRLFLFLFLLLPLSVGGYYALSLPIWKIQEVVVNGANMLSAEEIKDLSGVPISENLFLTGFARVRNNLGKITAIKEFHIYRIPPATVLIRIKERKPIAVVILKDKSAIVDKEGFILNRNPNLTLNVPNMTELPVVSGVVTSESPGEEKIDSPVSRLIAEIIVELSNLLGSRHIQLEIGGFEKINLLLDDLLRVKIGRDENIKRKMEVFKSLLPVIEGKWTQVEYVDVRYPDNPVVKYRQAVL
jgi:cell division protein FtsQ